MSKKSLTYKKARKNPNKRQDFLDQLFAANPSDAVERLIYDHNKKLSIEHIYKFIEQRYLTENETRAEIEVLRNDTKKRAFMLYIQNLFGKGHKFPVFVARQLFEYPTVKNVESELVHHEYFHAKDFSDGFNINNKIALNNENISLINIVVLEAILEVRALMNQISTSILNRTNNISAIGNAAHDFVYFTNILSVAALCPKANIFELSAIKAQLEICQNFMIKNIRAVKI